MMLTGKNTKYANTPTERACSPSTASPGFSRLELLVVAGALALLVCVTLPGLAGTRPRSDRVVCANNLRQIGQAFNTWANDYNDQKPCWVPFSSGGLSPVGNVGPLPVNAGMVGNAWYHFAWISNELRTPKLLVCPSDAGRNVKVAQDFSASPEGGFVHPNFRDRALSYLVGFHAYPGHATALLSGDRDLGYDSYGGCGTFPGMSVAARRVLPETPSGWGGELHGDQGNLLLNDGRVNWCASADLNRGLFDPLRAGLSMHMLPPLR